MTKTKIASVVMIAVILCAICLIFAGCPADDKNKKYDVTMKIICMEVVNGYSKGEILEEYIFTPDIDEMHIERKYDGKQYRYYVDKYNLPKHPEWSDEWFSWNGYGDNVFHSSLSFEGQMYYDEPPKNISEKHKYCYIFHADSTSNIWNYRSVRLYIDVK